MKPLSFVLDFLPWIVFTVVARRSAADSVAWSALLAVVITAVLLARARQRGDPTTLNAVSLVIFGVIAVLGFVGGPPVDDWLYTWGRPLVAVVLGLYVLATAGIRPFTEQYARQSTPRQYWGSPAFHAINRVISAAWGLGLVVIGGCSLLLRPSTSSSPPSPPATFRSCSSTGWSPSRSSGDWSGSPRPTPITSPAGSRPCRRRSRTATAGRDPRIRAGLPQVRGARACRRRTSHHAPA
jgi:hypothetical protein